MGKYDDAIGGGELILDVVEILNEAAADKVDKRIKKQKAELEQPIEINVKSDAAEKQLKELTKAAKQVKKDLSDAMSAGKTDFKDLHKSVASYEKISEQVKKLAPAVDKNNTALKEGNKILRETKKLVNQLMGVETKSSKRKTKTSTKTEVDAMKELVDTTNDAAKAQEGAAKSKMRTQQQVNNELDKELEKLKAIEEQQKKNNAARERFKKKQENYGQIALGTDAAVVDIDQLNYATQELKDFNTELEKRNKFQEKYNKLCKIVERSFLGKYGAAGEMWDSMDQFMDSSKAMKSLSKIAQDGIKGWSTKEINGLFKEVVNALRSEVRMTQKLMADGTITGVHVGQGLEAEEIALNQEMQSLLEERESQLTKINALRQEELDLIKQTGQEELKVAAAQKQKSLNMEAVIKRYNKLMNSVGREHLTIGTDFSQGTEKWNLRDMVSEAQYQLDYFYADDAKPWYADEVKEWRNEKAKLERFINSYSPLIEGMTTTQGHGQTKFDNTPDIETVVISSPIDEDELEIIKQENGALEDKLELLQEIAEQYANNVSQRDRNRLEELNQKDMNEGLTSREDERYWELSEAIDEADRQIAEFGETYNRVILKLENGKKIEILPDDAGLKKFDKIASEYYQGEYNGVQIEDVIFERVNAVTNALLEQKDAVEQLAEARLKLLPKKDSNGYTVPQTYTAADGKYEISQGKNGWDVFQKDNVGSWHLIDTYKTLNDIRSDSSLLAREEIVVISDVAKEVQTLAASYEDLSNRAGSSSAFAQKYMAIFDEVRKGALSAADAIKTLNEFIGVDLKQSVPIAAAKSQSAKIKVREYTHESEYLDYQDKYRDEHDGENEYLENVIDIVPRLGKDFARISADMITSCKKSETAVKRFFSALDPNKYPELTEWKAFIEEAMEGGMRSQSDKEAGWAWEVEALDDNKWYVSLIAIADAQSVVIKQAAEMQNKLNEAYAQNLGFHAGDLGKSETYGQFAYGRRDTGHFGTGTYLVGDAKHIVGYNERNGAAAPWGIVDFSQYNLFKPENTEQAWALHGVLAQINTDLMNMHKYDDIDLSFLQQAINDNNYAVLSDFVKKYVSEGSLNDYRNEALSYKQYLENSTESSVRKELEKIDRETLAFMKDFNNLSDDDWGDLLSTEYDFENRVKQKLEENKQILENFNLDAEIVKRAIYDIENSNFEPISKIQSLKNTLIDNLSNVFLNRTREEISGILEETFKIISQYSESDYYKVDNASTVFMKQLGYEGVDVRHTGLDNTGYGSVIYDLKESSVICKNITDEKVRQLIIEGQIGDALALNAENAKKVAEASQVVSDTTTIKEENKLLEEQAKAAEKAAEAQEKLNKATVKYVPIMPDGTKSIWGDTEDIKRARDYIHNQDRGFSRGMQLSVVGAEDVDNVKELDDITKQYNERRQQTQAILEKEKLAYQDILYLIKEYNQMYWNKLSNPNLATDAINLEMAIESKLGGGTSFAWDNYLNTLWHNLEEPNRSDTAFEAFANAIANHFKIEIPQATQQTEDAINDVVKVEEKLAEASENATNKIEQQKLAIGDVESSFGKDATRGLKLNDFFKEWHIAGNARDPIKQEIYNLAELYRDSWSDDSGNKAREMEDRYSKIVEMLKGACKAGEEITKIYNDFYNFITARQIAYDPDDMGYEHEFKDSWGQIRQSFSRILVSSKKNQTASHVDALYEEALSLFPELFSEDVTNHYDQMKALLDAVSAARDERNSKNVVTTEEITAALEEAFGDSIFVPMTQSIDKAIKGGTKDKVKDFTNTLSDLIMGDGDQDGLQTIVDLASDSKRMIELISSAAGKSAATKFLEGITSETDVQQRISGYFNEVFNSSDWKFKEGKGAMSVKGDTYTANLVNSAQDALQAVFKLDDGVLKLQEHLIKLDVANITDKFDADSAQKLALSSIEKIKADAERAKYDLTAITEQAKGITSSEDVTKFNAELKNVQNNIQAIKNSTATKSSMNPLINMQRDMKVAQTELDTMQLKLDKLGDIDGVAKASETIRNMTDALKEYNAATTSEGQQKAYNEYSDLRHTFKAQMEYINAAKALNDSQESEGKKTDPIREQYQSILDLVDKINAKSTEITKFQAKDGGSGMFAGYIEQLQSEKAKLVSELHSITNEINNTLSSEFVQGKEYSVPFASFLNDSGAISSFLNDTKTQASLTTEEIEKLVSALQKSQTIDVNAAAKVTEQFKSVQETYNRLSELTGLDQSNAGYQALTNIFSQIMQYRQQLSSDPTSWTPEESAHLQTLIDQFTKYGNALADVGEKEARYFSNKQKYTQGTTFGNAIQSLSEDTKQVNDIRKQLEDAAKAFAKDSGSGEAFVTSFAQSADGISRLDFSVFDSATNTLRKFRMEMGSVTEGMYVTETTVSKSLANIQAAQRQLQSAGNLIGKLDASGVSVDESNASAQVSKLLGLYKELSVELAKGDAADQNTITKLTSDLKIASSQTEKLYKQMLQMEDAIASGKAIKIGVGDPTGNVYKQLVDGAIKLANAEQGVTVETGRFDATTNTLNASLVHANGTVENLQLSMDGLYGTMVSQQTGVSRLTTSWDRFKASIASAGKRLMTALVGYNVFYKTISEVRKGISYVKEIDLALTELKKVTDETEESYRKFLNTAAGTAGEIGSTLSDFTEASANFARLGYTMEESAEMAKTAIVYKNVADGLDTVEESTDSIISTMKAFGIESDNTMGIVDRFNEVGNNFAITSAGIGEALQRSASALYAGGNTIDEAIGLVTAANSVIQNPEQVGTALKTLSLRIRGVKTELEEAGLETDGMAETTSKLQEQLKALTHGKVDILLDADTFKNTTQILREMSSAWEDMTDMEQAAALELLGGKRQANILSSLITNFETVEEVIETSMNSSGSAMAENAKWMDSIEGKSTKLANNMQAAWNKTLNSDWIKWFYDLAIAATDLTKKIGFIPPALAGVLVYFKAFKNIGPLSLFKDLKTNIQSYTSAIQQVQQANSLGFNNMIMPDTNGMLDIQAINAYSTAVAGMSAKQQAAILTSNGLSKVQSAQILLHNNVEEAIIKEMLGQEALNIAKAKSVVLTGNEIKTKLLENGVSDKSVVVKWLEAHATEQLTRDKILAAAASGAFKGATDEEITSLFSLIGATNTASFSLKGLKASLSAMFTANPFGFIAAGAGIAIAAISAIKNAIEDARKKTEEAANEAINKYKDTQSTLRDTKVAINDLSEDYAKLAAGVDEAGNNVSLSTSQYERYNEIVNKIADMFPQMVRGYTAEGNAIIKNKGNVEALTEAYKALKAEANNTLLTNAKDIMQNYKYTAEGGFWQIDSSTPDSIKAVNKLQEIINTQDTFNFDEFGEQYRDRVYDNIITLLDDAGIERIWNETNGEFVKRAIKEFPGTIQSIINTWESTINSAVSNVKPLVSAYLEQSVGYAGLGDKQKAMIDSIASSFDEEFFNQFDGNASKMYQAIESIVQNIKTSGIDEEYNLVLNAKTSFNNDEISTGEYKKQIDEFVSHLDRLKEQKLLSDNDVKYIKISLGFDESGTDINTSLNYINSLFGNLTDDIKSKISGLNSSDLQIINGDTFKVDPGTLSSWDEFTAKIEEARIAATKDFDLTNYTDAISAHSAAISEYQEALQKLGKGSFTMDDFMELVKKYPELAKGVDISSNAFHGLSRNLSGAIRTSTKGFVKDLKELRVSLVNAGKSTDSIDQLITAIENMPSDALDGTIQKYSTLSEKINEARQAQDKLLASMEENPNEGYETRGEAMEYMKEAMKKGEIGSESNLWNVAEKYGFTYDSAKTINENADALAKYIAIREKWFKEDDDGDDRTNDGYSYKGTENFIKDVESALKSSEELQKYLTWDYDESAGTLNFDYKNEDWDTIVSILSKTKELAGLTSNEFSDMMIQIGQYFNIKWGNYDDVLDHLNKIADGSSDAKTKVEEYGKAMQDYFGEDTTIDLTARPMLKFNSTNWSEWEKLYQEIVDNPKKHSEDEVKNATEQLEAIKKGNEYNTTYSVVRTSDDKNKSIVVTPILPNGEVLSPDELNDYARKLLAGEEIDPDINIKLAEFNGPTSEQVAEEYAQALHEAQAEYDILRDTLNINTTINEKGLEGLKEIKELQDAIITKTDGTIVLKEDAFKEALAGASYTEDHIDILIEKIKTLNSEAFNSDPLNIDDKLTNKGITGLQEINQLQGAIKQDADTELFVVDSDIFTSVLEEATYTEQQIQQLIDKIKEYNAVVISGSKDPLGLENASLSADSLKASLSTLGVAFSTHLGKWFDGKTDLDINVQDMVSALKAKGWTDQAIKDYMTKLSQTNLEGFRVDVKTDQIDAALKKANEVPEEKPIDVEIIGTAYNDLRDINSELDKIKDKTIDVTINETTVKKTKNKNGLLGFLGVADGTAHAQGTAFADGSWGAPKTETALVGELGPELLVRNGRWTTVGENGAEFTQVKKGDIIFNHRQTESLLKNGYVTSRGKAYASGTAYASGDGTFARYEFYDSGGYKQYDVNDKVVESWGDVSGAVDKASKSASDAKDKFEETLDWVEIRLEEINEQLDLMNAKLENASNYASKNNIIDDMIGVNKNKMSNLTAGIEKYSEYAARLLADVPAQYREAAQNGAIAITEFAGEADEKTVEAIENYREWAQKVADLNQQLEETKTTIRDLAIEKFDNAYEAGKVRADVEDSQTEKLQNAVDYDEARGLVSSSAYYTAMMENSNKKIEYLTNARAAMQKELDQAVRNGDIVKGSNEWYEMVNQMYEADAAIDEEIINLEEFQNAINDLYWDNFDELIDRIDYISDETQNLIDLMENSGELVDESGNWTNEGITSLGLYAQQMEIAEYRARQYSDAIKDLEKDYKQGKYSESEYLEKLNELKDAQYDSIESYYEAQDAIVDLNKTRVDSIKKGIEKEIDKYEELIKKKKDLLQVEKDARDFQRNTMEQQKTISDIERQLAALSVDNSASAVAQKKQLEAELAEAKTALDDTYYDRSIENQQNALDKELEDFQTQKDQEIEMWEEYLTKVDVVLTDSLNLVQENSSKVYDTLHSKADEYGLTLSDTVIAPWRDGVLAIGDYQDTFDTSMSSTMEQLDLLKDKWQAVVDTMALAGQANVAAINKENSTYTAAKKEEPKLTPTTTDKSSNTNKQTTQTKAAPKVGSTVTVKKSATHFSKQSGNAKMASFVPGGTYTVMQVGVNGDKSQILIGKNGQYTGWVKLTDLQGYAKGTTGIDEDQFALLHELGDELVLHAGKNGKLEYMTKGSGVVPADLTKRLMDIAMDPQEMLDRNRPEIAPSKSVVNNTTEIHIDASVDELIHVEHLNGNNLDEINKVVDKAWDAKMKTLNNAIRKFTR